MIGAGRDNRRISRKEVQVGVEWEVKKTLRGVMRIGDGKRKMEEGRKKG